MEKEINEKDVKIIQSDACIGHHPRIPEDETEKSKNDFPECFKKIVSKKSRRLSISDNIGKTLADQTEKLISLAEIDTLRNELDGRKESNLVACEAIIKKLSYFRKFTPFFRRKILSKCRFFQYENGDTVFRKGDIGDFLYIIVRGSVSIQVFLKI